ncbi:chemotaxis-specific protein-glutamate methyltransferase CheB [Rhizobium straminoryzae]|uniref:chemotaxis-specific protein-glutamate methyltransferase CheB n=1 Tax=Rhizobium straminoryzae TaxID=1387186 RepID=UPI001AEE9942|nr:chemotaxis-specific protein-glutamate methyltransferase CheB [Rhizobium straminoryzae]
MVAKILIVDDSALMRKHLSTLLSAAGYDTFTARNGREAVDMVLEHHPDVVTLDVNMPEMDGMTALSQIIAARPTPVIMVSSLTSKGALVTLEAMALGAVDYIAKPGGTISLSIDDIADEILAKVKSAIGARIRPGAGRRVPSAPRPAPARPTTTAASRKSLTGLVLIGVSTGGPRTLEEILPHLPASFPWAVAVAQHMPVSFTKALAQRMDGMCQLPVREASALDEIVPGTITIARGGSDLTVTRRDGRPFFSTRPESSAHTWHPSVELLVETAMEAFPAERLIAVQLTGMGNDGARAMARLHRQGGRTIAESEESAIIFGMPKELIQQGGASLVLPASRIASQLSSWIR